MVGKTLKPFTALIGVFFVGVGLYVYWVPMNSVSGISILGCTLLPIVGYILGTGVGRVRV